MRNPTILLIMTFLVLAISVSILLLERILSIELRDYSLIVWNFAISITIVLLVITVVKYRKRKKKTKEKPRKEIKIYAEPKEKYRAEYY